MKRHNVHRGPGGKGWVAELRRDNIIFSDFFDSEAKAMEAYQAALNSDEPKAVLPRVLVLRSSPPTYAKGTIAW
jgi:hypothetical protein